MINKISSLLIANLPKKNRLERIWILAKTDFKKRYYGTSLGILWALINPIFQLIIYYFVFSVFFKNDVPNFSLYLFSGLILWMFISESNKKGMYMISSNRHLIEMIRIDKHDIITAGLVSNSLALIFNFFVYFIVAAFFDIQYNANLLYLPLIIFNLMLITYGVNLILSIIYVYLRDFDHFWDIFMIAAFWANPIVYNESILYQYKIVLYLNPISGLIINMHNCLIYGKSVDFELLQLNLIFGVFIFIVGIFIFKHHSKKVIEIL
ncbi:MAG: ABC-type polysaccharide/polyol phosphate export permease [Flavobacteriaceae bacterium]|jgi:ABC-type polysaccharide/polyol phosphate export permease